jgi:four helix bundle protein
MIKSYKDLEVYRKSYQTALELHQMTLEFPRHELYELGSQMRRAATSIPLNIAEGYGRKNSSNEFKQF